MRRTTDCASPGVTAMTPEEAFATSDEVEDTHSLQFLLQSIKTLAEKGLGRSN
jgi:hypothetical protein